MFNFLNESHNVLTIDDKDFKRMLDLYNKKSAGYSIADKIKDPNKIAARYVAGTIISNSKFPSEEEYNNYFKYRSIERQKVFGYFWYFIGRAIELEVEYNTLNTLYLKYVNYTLPAEEKPLIDLSVVQEQMELINNAYSNGKTLMWFTNLSAAFLFYWEELGQISDGKYENSLPTDHWTWIPYLAGGCKIYVDPSYTPACVRAYNIKYNTGGRANPYTAMYSPKKYNIRDLVKYDDIAERLMTYGRLGKALPNTTLSFEKYTKGSDEFRSICEYLGETKLFEYVDEFLDDLVKRHPYYDKHINKYENSFTQQDYDAYYNVKYTFADLKQDLKIMDLTVNNFVKCIEYKKN